MMGSSGGGGGGREGVGNVDNSISKMSSAMALVASSRRIMASSTATTTTTSSSSSSSSSSSDDTKTTNRWGTTTGGGIQKRRSLAECVVGTTTTTSNYPSSAASSSSSSSSSSAAGGGHVGAAAGSLYKRPRTSWGKPHSNPSLLLSSPPLLHLQQLYSSHPPPSSPADPIHPPPHHYDQQYSFSTSHFIVPTTPSSNLLFVKTEPLQNLTVFTLPPPHSVDQSFADFEDENDDEPRLHQVPSFFPIEHLLLDMNAPVTNASMLSTGPARSLSLNSPRSPGCFPASLSGSACVSSSSPVSPLSVSTANSPLYSSSPADVEYNSISGDLSWARSADCIEDESCDFLSDRFYEIETEMRCIMGEHDASIDHQHRHHHYRPPHQHHHQLQDLTAELPDSLNPATSPVVCAAKLVVPKLEEVTCNYVNQNTSTVSGLSSTSRTTQESDEEYRIDLTDFDVEQGDSGVHCLTLDVYEQKALASSSNARRKMALTLNYDDVINAWSDRGPPLADGSWPETMMSPDEVELDLAAWEPENQLIAATQSLDCMGLNNVAGTMIQLPEADSASAAMMLVEGGGDHPPAAAAPTSAVRQASVLRYREKRRTRLFSKKIRYEVRKLNAERRPRMKGRFIKRSSLD